MRLLPLFALVVLALLLLPQAVEAAYLSNTKTLMVFINSSAPQVASNAWWNSTFSVQINDPNPRVISAFVEVSGTHGIATTTTQSITVAQNGGAGNAYSFTNTGEVKYFTVLDNATSHWNSLYNITNNTARNLPVGVKCVGDACNILAARAIITYQYDSEGTGSRTVDFYVNSSGGAVAAATWWNSSFTAALTDTGAVVKKAWFETWGVTEEGTADQTLTIAQNMTTLGSPVLENQQAEVFAVRLVNNATVNETYILNSTPATFTYNLKTGANEPLAALGTVLRVAYDSQYPPKTKTVELFINSSPQRVAISAWWNSSFKVQLDGVNVQVKSAYIKLAGGYPGSTGTNDNTLDLRINGTNILSPLIYGSTPSVGFVVVANATGPSNGLYGITDNSSHAFDFGVKCGASDECEAMSATAVITYTSDDVNNMDTVEYFVNSSTATVSANTWWNSTFTINPLDQDFSVRSAFLQVEGFLPVSTATTAIGIVLNSTPFDRNTTTGSYEFEAGVELFNYMIRHNATSLLDGFYNISAGQAKDFTVSIRCESGAACPLKSVKLVLTGTYSSVPRPRFINNASSIASGQGINLLTNYTFSTNVSTESAEIINVTFETDLNASLKNFTIPAAAGGNATQKFFFINFTGSTLSTGNFQYRWIANDSLNGVNTTGIIPFSIGASEQIFINNDSSRGSNLPVNASLNYGFSTNISTPGTEIVNVTFETNLNASLKNFTLSKLTGGNTTQATYTINFTGLTNGTYQYRWIVNDSASSSNTTGVIPYTINNLVGNHSIKTIEWFINSTNSTPIAGNFITNFSIYIPERGVSVKSAWIELYAEGTAAAGDNFALTMNGTPLEYASKGGLMDADQVFPAVYRFNASNASAGFNGLYGLQQGENNFGITLNGFAKNSFNNWLKAYVTYEYDISSETHLKTITYFVNRTQNITANSNFTTIDFNLYLPEDQIAVRNAFIEISGETNVGGTAQGKADVYINQTALDYGLNRSVQTAVRSPVRWAFNASNSTESYKTGFYNAGTGNNYYNVTARTYTNRLDNAWIKATVTYSYASNSTTQLKHVKFFGNRTFFTAANTNWSSFMDMYIPESSVAVRNAYLTVYTQGNGTAGGAMNITVNGTNLQYGNDIGIHDTDFISPKWIVVNGSDGFGELYSTTTGDNRYNVTLWVRTQAQSNTWFAADLLYTYPNDSSTQLKTIAYFTNFSNTTNAGQNASTQALYIYTPDNPAVRNSWLDISVKGSTTGAGQIRVWVNHSQVQVGQIVIPDADTVLSPVHALFNGSKSNGNGNNGLYNLSNATTKFNLSTMVVGQQMFDIAPTAWFTYTYTAVAPNNAPNFTNNATSVPSATTYSPGKNYGFQTNWSDDGSTDVVLFEANLNESLKNYTVPRSAGDQTNGLYIINFSDLAGGSYQYRWVANDTLGKQNSTAVVVYSVAQNSTNYVDLTLNNGTTTTNNNKTMLYGANIIATATKLFSTAGTANLFRNGTSVGSTETIKLGAGSYEYKVNMSSNTNYSANDTGATYFLFIDPASTVTTLTISPTSPITYPTTSQCNCSSSNNDTGVTVTLYRNVSGVFRDVTTAENGTAAFRLNATTQWQYICNSTSTQNYTTNNTVSLNYNVLKGATNITILLNGTDAARDYNDTDTLNITVNINSSSTGNNYSVQTVKLDTNFSGWSIQSGAPPLVNLTGPFSAANYNVTGYFDGDENYSASSRTVYTNVTAPCSISIGLSTNLTAPIGYDVTNPGTTINATGNNGTGVTTFSVQITNTACSADLWLSANDDLLNKTGGTYRIGIGNMTFLNSSTDNTLASGSYQTMSLTDQLVKSKIAAGTTNIYFKFRLTVPTAQTPGLYNNSIVFTANKSS